MELKQPKEDLTWDMQSVPEDIYRLRWKLILVDGTEINSAWTPGDYPSFSRALETNGDVTETLVIEAECQKTHGMTEMARLPFTEFKRLQYMGMFSTRTSASTVAGFQISTTDGKEHFCFINGVVYTEEGIKS